MKEAALTEDTKEKLTVDSWEVKDAADTLLRAQEIRADKKLMALVSKNLTKKASAINSISDIKAKAAELNQEEDEEDEEDEG